MSMYRLAFEIWQRTQAEPFGGVRSGRLHRGVLQALKLGLYPPPVGMRASALRI